MKNTMAMTYTLKCEEQELQIATTTLERIPTLWNIVQDLGNTKTTLEVRNVQYASLVAIVQLLEENVVPPAATVADIVFLGLEIPNTASLSQAYSKDSTFDTESTGLVELTEELWTCLAYDFLPETDEILRYDETMMKKSWFDVCLYLQNLNKYQVSKQVMVAGRTLYAALFGTAAYVDLYLLPTPTNEARNITARIAGSMYKVDMTVLRMDDCVIFDSEVRVSLTQYPTLSDLLYSFDIDCEGIGYYDGKIWMTHRCWYALQHRMNTYQNIPAERQYAVSRRLCRYGSSGMAIRIPGYQKTTLTKDIRKVMKNKDLTTLEGIELFLTWQKQFIQRDTAHVHIYTDIGNAGYTQTTLYSELDVAYQVANNKYDYVKRITKLRVKYGCSQFIHNGGNLSHDLSRITPMIYHSENITAHSLPVQSLILYKKNRIIVGVFQGHVAASHVTIEKHLFELLQMAGDTTLSPELNWVCVEK
jgi:hypothetical protein